MIGSKFVYFALFVWCCVLYGKMVVECHSDDGTSINRQKRLTNGEASENDLVKGLVLEALELENNFSELQKSVNVTASYQRLFDKINRVRLYDGNKDNEQALLHLKLILRHKLFDMEEGTSLILDVESFDSRIVSNIELRMRTVPEISNINDVDLKHNMDQLRFGAMGNFALNEYQRYIDGFRLTYFPYAVCYLESLQIPTTPTAYDNLNAINVTIIDHLNEAKRHIEDMKLNMRDVTYLEGKEPDDAFYIWKNADVRDKIPQLFKGEQITLLADVKTATKQLNALKFNKLDLIFRSSNQTVHDQLGRAVKAFMINLKQNGKSTFRYNDNFFQLESHPLKMFFTFEKIRRTKVPVMRNGVYTKLRDNRPVLSPYTEWKLQLTDSKPERFDRLTPFEQLDIDIELHGSGSYVADGPPLCKEDKLSEFYTRMEH